MGRSFFIANNLIKDSSGADYQLRKHPTPIEAYTTIHIDRQSAATLRFYRRTPLKFTPYKIIIRQT